MENTTAAIPFLEVGKLKRFMGLKVQS